MTVRDFIQIILIEAPRLDAEVLITMPIDDIECESYIIENITSDGSNDSLSIYLENKM